MKTYKEDASLGKHHTKAFIEKNTLQSTLTSTLW